MQGRRNAFKVLHQLFLRPPTPIRTVLVLIDDQEFYLGDPAGRRPMHRDYLARLVRAVAGAKPAPAVIAIDFLLRSPSPDGNPIDHPDYKWETAELIAAVNEASPKSVVVLPRTIVWKNGGYVNESAVYDDLDIAPERVSKGYINLPKGDGKIPFLTVKLPNGNLLDSFAQAIVRADNPHLLTENLDGRLPYGEFNPLERFTRVLARDVLRSDPSALAELHNKVVILAGHWHADGLNRGDFIDVHDSPIGKIPGALLHANYVERMIDSRLYWEWKNGPLQIAEIITALLVALISALKMSWWAKILGVVGIIGLVFVGSIFSLLIFALVFDFFIPAVMIVLHGLFAPVLESKFLAGRNKQTG